MENVPVVRRYQENYRRIFQYIYPALGSTGFTERNLSVNFARAYESIYSQAITWYEFPFGAQRNLHYDAIIVNPEQREILVIESKRFNDVAKKVGEVGKDILRISQFLQVDLQERIPDLEQYKVLGVILADVWTEGESKERIKQSFLDGTFLQDYRDSLPKQTENPDKWYFFCEDFAELDPSPVRDNAAIRKTYYLVGMIWDVKGEV